MLKNNTVLKILSVLIAICLWMYVMGSVNPVITQTVENIPVELLSEDTLEQRGLAVRGNTGFSVDIVVEGKRSTLHELDKNKIKATVDLFGYEEGQNSVPVQVEVPEGIGLKEVKTPRIEITVDELISAYKKVEVRFTGKYESGTEPGILATSPAEIEVKGPKTLVDAVETVQAKVNAGELTSESQTFQSKLRALDKDGEQVYDVTLSAETAEVDAVLYRTKTVPLEVKVIGNLPRDYELTEWFVPGEITICGSKEDLEDIEKLETEPVDMSQIKNSTTLELTPDFPDGVQLSTGSKKPVAEIQIKRSSE